MASITEYTIKPNKDYSCILVNCKDFTSKCDITFTFDYSDDKLAIFREGDTSQLDDDTLLTLEEAAEGYAMECRSSGTTEALKNSYLRIYNYD